MSTEKEIENVRVFIRVRPLSNKEKQEGRTNVVGLDLTNNLIALDKTGNENYEKLKPYKFDKIFGPESKQADLYRIIAAPIVDKSLCGYNGTILAYGQTGTGKTYSMTGEPSPELRGIIPNSFAQIFSHISKMTGERTYAVTASYVEIYNEEVRDLLSAKPNKKMVIAEAPGVGIYVKELGCFAADSSESLMNVLEQGNKNRITRSTMMNETSSRSHAIFTINIECKNNLTNVTTYGKLNLVDLAGSERVSRTHATGDLLKEASNINLSLSALGNVISALVDGRSTHIPYRNSKLTRLLQDSLGGNSKTAMIATISPSDLDYEEGVCTLRYAARVKFIKNTVVINSGVGIIDRFEAEIAELQSRVSQLYEMEVNERPGTSIEKQNKPKKVKDKAAIEAKAEEKKKYEELLERNTKEKDLIATKIAQLQKKLLVGGENLFEKAQQQMRLLESSTAEIENLDKTHQQLEETLNKKGAERIDVEEKYSSLQEEDSGVSKKIKKVQILLNGLKEEYADKEHEHQREMETLQDNSRLLTREMQLAKIMIDSYIPKEYYKELENNMQWNNDAQEFQMKGVAYTGNNMKKGPIVSANSYAPSYDKKLIYHKYSEKKHTKTMYERKMIPTPKKH